MSGAGVPKTATRRQQLISSLTDKETREIFVEQHVSVGLAFQIRSTRLARGWTQEELGRRAGIAQETVCLLESTNYGRYTLRTLTRLAAAFDVALVVKFAPFSALVDWEIGLSPEDLAVPDFEHDVLCPNDSDEAVS